MYGINKMSYCLQLCPFRECDLQRMVATANHRLTGAYIVQTARSKLVEAQRHNREKGERLNKSQFSSAARNFKMGPS